MTALSNVSDSTPMATSVSRRYGARRKASRHAPRPPPRSLTSPPCSRHSAKARSAGSTTSSKPSTSSACEPSPASVSAASRGSISRQLAGRSPAWTIARTASQPPAKVGNATLAARRSLGLRAHAHPRLGDHRQRALGAEQQAVGRRAGAGGGQPARLPLLARDGERADRLAPGRPRASARWRSGRPRGWRSSRRASRARTTAGRSAASGRGRRAAPPAAGPLAPAWMRAARETGSTSSTRSSRERSSDTAPAWPGPGTGSTPPTTLVPPP